MIRIQEGIYLAMYIFLVCWIFVRGMVCKDYLLTLRSHHAKALRPRNAGFRPELFLKLVDSKISRPWSLLVVNFPCAEQCYDATNLDLTLAILADATPACVESALGIIVDGIQKLNHIESIDLDKDENLIHARIFSLVFIRADFSLVEHCIPNTFSIGVDLMCI